MKKQSRFLIVVVVVTVLLAGQFMFNLTSTRASSTVVFHGNFTVSHQQDFYTITVVSDGTVTAETSMSTCTAGSPTNESSDTYLLVHSGSSGGPVVAENDDFDSGGVHSACSYVSFSATAGIYVIQATTFRSYVQHCSDATTCLTVGPYSLTVTGNFAGSGSGSTSSPASVTFFNPGDVRRDGRPGDRLVVWCNQPGQVVVYGTVDNMPDYQKGFLLGVFKDADLIKAGDKGLSHDAGSAGVVSISLMKGWLWVAWNGGVYHATGQKDFVKSVDFSQCAPANNGHQ